ncbi:MAG: ribosome silencing factor [Deferrisomatales bacterium]|nr:ribosome silencing factor [Deferrisomatales bacterium]
MSETGILDRVLDCARVAADKRGTDIVVLDVGKMSSFTDYFLIVSGSSDRRVQTIAESIVQRMKEQGVLPLGVEGLRDGRWALIDFGDWVVHVFYEEARGVFDLEEFWFDAPRVELPEDLYVPVSATPGGRQG